MKLVNKIRRKFYDSFWQNNLLTAQKSAAKAVLLFLLNG